MSNYISNRLANHNNLVLHDSIGQELDAKIVKVRWNSELRHPEVIYEINLGSQVAYAVDVVTEEKRKMYLQMFHAKAKTMETSLSRPNETFQLSLAACFGCIRPLFEVRAVIQPNHVGPGIIGVKVMSSYELRNKGVGK